MWFLLSIETDLPTAVVKETVRVTVGTAAAASAVYNDFWTWAENSLPRTMNTRRPEYDPAANADSIPVPNDSQVTHDKLLEILIKKIDNMSARSSADRLDHTSLLYLLLAASVLLLFRWSTNKTNVVAAAANTQAIPSHYTVLLIEKRALDSIVIFNEDVLVDNNIDDYFF